MRRSPAIKPALPGRTEADGVSAPRSRYGFREASYIVLSDLIRISLRQIYRNRRRYRSAIIGTSLGIAGLLTVLTIGDSVETALGENLEMLGSATIVKAKWDYGRTQRWHRGQYRFSDVEDLRKLPYVLSAAPAIWSQGRISYRKKKKEVFLVGAGGDFFKTIHLPVSRGRPLTAEDNEKHRSVCVIGLNIRDYLFGEDANPVGESIVLSGLSFEIVGLTEGAEDPDYRDSVLIPITVAAAKIPRMGKIKDIYVRAANWDVVEELQSMVGQVLERNHEGYETSMSVTYYKERIAAIQAIVFTFKFFLYAAIVVTLLLGAAGITNVMLSVVRERTTEIGLRKAVGATHYLIIYQFLCEALSVSVIGSAIGIGAGIASVKILSDVLQIQPEYNVFMSAILASAVISLLIGVTSGVLPAVRAGRLDPMEAMKFE